VQQVSVTEEFLFTVIGWARKSVHFSTHHIYGTIQDKTRAKDVLPNTNRTQPAKITPPDSDGLVLSAAE